MNKFGSYRALIKNSQAAICAGIEVYNRPALEYRDQSAVLLLINAYELMLKVELSKKRVPIFYPKERDKPYRSLTFCMLQKSLIAFSAMDTEPSGRENLEIEADFP